uniref:DUF4211 domain-containing protein n=1 Tax=Auxenochlorella protothecoides TaxID=3075 RepID=A0A1D2A0J5_AUXPR
MVVVTRRSRALIIPDDSGSEAERHGAGAPPSPPRQSAPAQCPTTSPPSPQGATPHGSAAHTQPPLAEEDTSGSEGSRGCREWRVRPRPKRGGSPGVREGGRPVVRARLLAGGPGDYEDGDDSGASGDLGDFIVDDEIERTSSSSSIAADSERPGDEDSGVRAAVRRQRILARRSVLCSSSSSSSSSSGMGDGAGAVSGPAGAKTLQSGGRPGRRGQAGAAALAPSPGTQVRLRRRVPRLCVAEVLERGGRRWYEAVHAQGSEREDEGADAGPPTDEGDPSASLRTSTSGSAREEGVEAVARPLRPSPALGVLRATAMLGVQLSSYTPRQLFDIYCEYRLLVDVDPGYEDRVATSPQHQQYYRNAVQAVEWKLGRARDAAASSFWRSSARGLVEALETLPGIECSWSIDPLQPRAGDADQDDGPICQACRRSRSHAVRELVLRGRPVELRTSRRAPRRTSDQFAEVSPAFQRTHRRRPLSESSGTDSGGPGNSQDNNNLTTREAEGRRRARFLVGRFCCARLFLYHALFHWERRLRARLRQETKSAWAQIRGESSRGEVAARVLAKSSLLETLYDIFSRLCQLADQYLLSGGEGGYRGRFGAPDTSAEIHALVESLHDDVEAEESSVRWVGSSLDQSGESGGSGEVVSRAAARPDNGPGEPGRAPPGGAGAGDMSAPSSSSGGNAGSEARRQASSGAIGRGAEPGGEAVDAARPGAALARRGRHAVILTSLDDSE